MLSRNKIDKKLKNYIKEHLGKGYSKHAVKHVLVKHGYDEAYVDGLLRRHSELQFVKKYALIASFLLVISIFSFNLVSTSQKQTITGYAISESDEGCCTSICQQTAKQECYGDFIADKKCNELQQCTVGCCIDRESYCLTNYLYDNCLAYKGISIYRDCNEVIYCRNLTDSTTKKYDILNKAGFGVADVEPFADYYGSSFNIKFYAYDKTNVESIEASIKDDEIIDKIMLYDDGSHNDGVNNDNIYGNNWPSSKMKAFDGFKKLEIDIVIQFTDNTVKQLANAAYFVVLSNNKCLPIFTKWSPLNQYSLIFAADNYNNLSYQQFENDVNNALDVMFSTNPFLSNRDNYNVYRLEEALAYFDMQTLLALISNSCMSYDNKQDLVVIFDNSEKYCVAQGAGVVRVNPQFFFYKNITSAGINETIADFCNYALTPKKLADNLLQFSMPPKIVIHTPDNIVYSTNIVNFSFSISSINYPLNSSIFLENSLVSSSILNKDATDSIALNLENGTNPVLVTATDKNKNTAFAQVFLNVSI